jgi:hypothetical protein
MQMPNNDVNLVSLRNRIDKLAVVIKSIADRQRTHTLNSKPSKH